jgi:hypothetical protein
MNIFNPLSTGLFLYTQVHESNTGSNWNSSDGIANEPLGSDLSDFLSDLLSDFVGCPIKSDPKDPLAILSIRFPSNPTRYYRILLSFGGFRIGSVRIRRRIHPPAVKIFTI